MRVLVVHNRYRTDAPSGEDRVVDLECAGLRDLGHDVQRFERHSDEIMTWGPLQKTVLPVAALWGSTARHALGESLDAFRPEVVHVHNLFPLISPQLLRWCAARQIPVVATLHNYNLVCARGSMYRDNHPCVECADGSLMPALRHRCYHESIVHTLPVVAGLRWHRAAWRELVSAYLPISHAMLEQLLTLQLPPARVFVKHNFVPDPGPVRCDPRHQVAYVGRLEESKGLRVLMRAWERLRAECPGSLLRLVIAGGGTLADEVKAWAARQPEVDFLGVLARDEVTSLVAGSRCSVMPSVWRETFGLVAVESMALAVPPIATDHGAFPEIVTSGEDGLLVPPGDAEALAAVLRQVDQDPGHFARLGRRGRQTYEQSFAPGPNLERLVEHYTFAIKNPVVPGGVEVRQV